MKEKYIALMEQVVGAYTREHIDAYTAEVRRRGLWEHGYPRLCSNIGILLAHGRKQEMREIFPDMMDLCIQQIPLAKLEDNRAGNDFSVKEVVFCILELEKAAVFPKEMTERWRHVLAKLDPYKTYYQIAKEEPEPVQNWASFGAASEQLKKYAGIADNSAFIERQMQSLLLSFDENGMYVDPDKSAVYDIIPRLQLATTLHFGYDGKGMEELEKFLLSGVDITLRMQSAAGEIPFGGRSNQFLHNETFFAAMMEFYASLLHRKGDTARAAMCKRAAGIATEAILPYLRENPMRHIKNFYATDSGYGCEKYAYYDKYMVTAASWLYLAYVMADDTIPEAPCPAETGGYICKTGPLFHKIFMNKGGYSAEIELEGNTHYDANGIGKIQKKGAPAFICLSTPFPSHPSYKLDMDNASPFSVCGGLLEDDVFHAGYEEGAKYELIEEKQDEASVMVRLGCTLLNGAELEESCTVSENGVRIEAQGKGEVAVFFPVFLFDGQNRTRIHKEKNCITVQYRGWKCSYKTDARLIDLDREYANRNGHYKAFAAVCSERAALEITIKGDCHVTS